MQGRKGGTDENEQRALFDISILAEQTTLPLASALCACTYSHPFHLCSSALNDRLVDTPAILRQKIGELYLCVTVWVRASGSNSAVRVGPRRREVTRVECNQSRLSGLLAQGQSCSAFLRWCIATLRGTGTEQRRRRRDTEELTQAC